MDSFQYKTFPSLRINSLGYFLAYLGLLPGLLRLTFVYRASPELCLEKVIFCAWSSNGHFNNWKVTLPRRDLSLKGCVACWKLLDFHGNIWGMHCIPNPRLIGQRFHHLGSFAFPNPAWCPLISKASSFHWHSYITVVAKIAAPGRCTHSTGSDSVFHAELVWWFFGSFCFFGFFFPSGCFLQQNLSGRSVYQGPK